MSETFPPDVQDFVRQAIAKGEYANEDDVVIDAVRALRELKNRHQSLRVEIQAAIAELDAGQGESWDAHEIKRELGQQFDGESRK